MKNEMQALNMDELQQQAWLRANRATLMLVGSFWLGLIGWSLAHGGRPWFMMIMVPVFGASRAGFYRWYCRRG